MMGAMICETITELGGVVIHFDIKDGFDITSHDHCLRFSEIENLDILVNNAVGNQSPVKSSTMGWKHDLDVGLTGAARMIDYCSIQLRKRKGVILNMGSDLSLIGPDQTLYPNGLKKPLSYSVVKHGIVGMTRYFATLWPEVRCNCLCPGGIDIGQKTPHVPMGRLAQLDEMKGPVAFLISNASSYMTGAVLSVDGGRTCW
jgi:NAD(P)-dependent dehydrogenase (short-subunit alcohol dehydrogenase family)